MSKLTRNREGFLISDTQRECTVCGIIYNKTSKTVTLCPTCNSNRVKCSSTEYKLHQRAKVRSKIKGLDFNIDVKDIILPEYCPVLGIKLECHKGTSGGKPESPALDRIDNSKGYVKGNIMVISQLANCMKTSANPEQLLTFANWIQETYTPASNNETS